MVAHVVAGSSPAQIEVVHFDFESECRDGLQSELPSELQFCTVRLCCAVYHSVT